MASVSGFLVKSTLIGASTFALASNEVSTLERSILIGSSFVALNFFL
jgi:hypothetical protein